MLNEYYFYGPSGDINLRLKDEVRSLYGEYEYLPENVQYALQLLCHAVLQLAPTVKQTDAGVLWLDNALVIINTHGNDFSVNNIATGMAVMNLYKDADGSYSTDFFSITQLTLINPIILRAYEDADEHGRRG